MKQLCLLTCLLLASCQQGVSERRIKELFAPRDMALVEIAQEVQRHKDILEKHFPEKKAKPKEQGKK